MNRKQYAMERKFLSQSDKGPRHPKTGARISWKEKYLAEKLWEENKKYFLKGYWMFQGFKDTRKNWEIERDTIIKEAKTQASKEWMNGATLGDTNWYDFLESYAVAEFSKRQSPLYKML